MVINRIVGEKFKGQTLALDYNQFENCIFEDCILQYSGFTPASYTGCTFINSNFTFLGPADSTLQFIKQLNQSGEGGRRLVQQMLGTVNVAQSEVYQGASA